MKGKCLQQQRMCESNVSEAFISLIHVNVDTPIELVESMTSIQTTEMMLQNTTTTTSNSQMILFSHNIKYEYVHPTLVLLSRQRERERYFVVPNCVRVSYFCSIKAKADSVDHQLRYGIPTNCFSLKQYHSYGEHVNWITCAVPHHLQPSTHENQPDIFALKHKNRLRLLNATKVSAAKIYIRPH